MSSRARFWRIGSIGVLIVAIAAVLIGCGGGSTGGNAYGGGQGGSTSPVATPSEGALSVSIKDFSFAPATLTVKAGETVTWTNEDAAPHTVTSTDGPGVEAKVTSLFDSGSMGQGETFSYTFETAGTYAYECTIHAGMASMHAEVVVK